MKEKVFGEKQKGIYCAVELLIIILFFSCRYYQDEGVILYERIFEMIVWTAVFAVLLLEKRIEYFCEKYVRISSMAAVVLIPFFMFLNLEIMTNSNLDQFGKKKIAFNMIIIYLLTGVVLVIVNRTRMTLKIVVVLLTVLGVTNIYLTKFRGMPLMAADIFSIRTAANVANNYDYSLKWRILYGVYVSFILWMLINKLYRHKALEKRKRIFCAVWVICGIGVFYGVLFKTKIPEEYAKIKIRYSVAKNVGNVLTLVYSAKSLRVEEPEGYDRDEVETVMNEYKEGNTGYGGDVNIIAIMNEAFSDLGENVELTEDNMPYIHSLEENTIKGHLYTSVFAGNTANTEFEFLTGNSMAFVPPSTVPYQLYVRGNYPSLAHTLKAQGYAGNVAIHPFKINGFNRPNAYRSMGFDKFIGQKEFENPEYVRKYISDSSSFAKIIECYEETENTLFYAFNVTMQNHSGYYYPEFETPIQVAEAPGEYPGAEQYLNLIKKSDEAFEELVEYFSKVDENTIIVMFGDHRPGIEQGFYNLEAGKSKSELSPEEYMSRYKVPFIIWANFDIEENYIDKISANYLGSLVLETAGCKMTGYQKYLSDLREEVVAINVRGYWGENGNYYELEDESSPYYDKLQEYRNIQYNNMFDERNEEFFFLKK